MNKIQVLDRDGNELNMELIFSFVCKETGKNYVALYNNDSVFEKNSRFANIDILEMIQVKSRYIYVSTIPDEDWDTVKHCLQFNVFSKMN